MWPAPLVLVCLQLLSEFLLGQPVKVSLLHLYFLYPPCFFIFTSLRKSSRVIRNSHPALAAYFCHLATNHHLEIYPTIKSFSRNLAPRLWNARWSRSGWAVQSQSWSVCTLPPQCHLSCFWRTNATPQETSEVRLVTKPPSSPAGAAAV